MVHGPPPRGSDSSNVSTGLQIQLPLLQAGSVKVPAPVRSLALSDRHGDLPSHSAVRCSGRDDPSLPPAPNRTRAAERAAVCDRNGAGNRPVYQQRSTVDVRAAGVGIRPQTVKMPDPSTVRPLAVEAPPIGDWPADRRVSGSGDGQNVIDGIARKIHWSRQFQAARRNIIGNGARCRCRNGTGEFEIVGA